MMIWVGFTIFIVLLLALDLGVLNKRAHVPTTREALAWTLLWVTVACSFGIFVYYAYSEGWVENVEGLSPGIAVTKYLTGYVVEQSLSIDNIFVIAMIFAYFHIPQKHQHRILFWGILGAIFFRGVMIAIGAVLIHRYSWVIYIFAIILLYSAWKMWRSGDEMQSLEKNTTVKLVRKFLPLIRQVHSGKFVVRRMGVVAITPLLLALIVVETTDILFAFDSIPAIFGITTDPFLIFTSNIFAVLGLRSLYFVVASLLSRFRYLKPALVFILFFVGVKMLASQYVHLPEWVSLAVILLSLATGITVSLVRTAHESNEHKTDI